ncbi:MAG: adenosylcobalamin-dependent ribonucleoside-diphosphate reductase, partial [Anaerolineae bacterium]
MLKSPTPRNDYRDQVEQLHLTENARAVLERRYLRKGEDGKPVETVEEMFYRVASTVAGADADYGQDAKRTTQDFYDLLTSLRFFPNSPTFTGAGTPLGQLAACFVLPIEDDMGRDPAGIFSTLRVAALIQQTGGGNGFAFSRLRPRGDIVSKSAGVATGPVGFLRVYDKAFGEVAQGGCLVPETLIFTALGLLRLDEIVTHEQPGWRAHELMVATDEGLQLSTHTYNNGVVPVIRVKTDVGLELTGTPDHKVKVMAADGPVWRRLQDLHPGDAIQVKLGQHQGRLQTLAHPERQHGNQVMPELPTVLDEELAFFLGYMVGDGFVASADHDHRIGVTVAHSSYLIDDMPQIMARLFGEHLTIHCAQKENDASATFSVDNRAVKEFLLLNGLDKGRSTEVSVPRLIRQSPVKIAGAFLRGLFEADGTITHGYPQLLSSSERLIREVAVLLIGLGCPVRVFKQPTGADRYGQADIWSLRVQSFKGLESWRTNVGCDPRSRFSACAEFEPDLSREVSYALPHAEYWVSPVLEATQLPQIDRQGRGQGKNFRSTTPHLRRKLLRYARGDRQLTLSGYELLSEEYNEFAEYARPVDDSWFITVTSVKDAGEALTLDLEVGDNHTYLANGYVTHNTRRGANMSVLRVDHPDVRDFIRCKTREGDVTNFNISVGITDDFMRAVQNDEDFDLVNPRDGSVWDTVRARDLFDEIVKYAHHNGEPGVLFLDTANRENPVPHLYELEATNPCGEQFLGPYENCCLGSINLARHVTEQGDIDWENLRETIERATHFLDNVVSTNKYVPAVPELEQAAHSARRIGLGIMGLADLMYHQGVRYGSEDGEELAAQVMEFVRFHCMKTSIELARQRGAFPAIEGSIYDPKDLKWKPPTPLTPYRRDFGRPPLDWSVIVEGIRHYGIRNAAQTTVAPTGTIATVAGCEGYGCEPVFALAYIRHVQDGERELDLQYASPLFQKALIEAGIDEAGRQAIYDEVMRTDTCQHIEAVPTHIRHTFVVAGDITPEEHVRMQAAIQRFVDNSLSKCVTGDTLVMTAEGLRPIAELSNLRQPDQFEPLIVDLVTPAGKEGTNAFYYGGFRETRRVRFSYGFELEGTPNHRIHILTNNGAVEWRRLDELKIGDTAILYTGQFSFGGPGQPLPAYSGEFRTCAKAVQFPAHMSVDLAFLLGCIVSEGAITQNGVTIANSDRELLERLATLFKRLLDLDSYILPDLRRESLFTLQVNSRPLRNWLLADLGMGAGAENKIIPLCIWQASRDEQAAFMRGLMLDGYVTADGKMWGLGLASRGLVRQVQTLLLNFDIVGTMHQTGEKAWTVSVSGGELEKLSDFI